MRPVPLGGLVAQEGLYDIAQIFSCGKFFCVPKFPVFRILIPKFPA